MTNCSRIRFESRSEYLFVELDCGGLTYQAALAALGDIMVEAAHQRCRQIMIKCSLGSIETDEMVLGSILVLAELDRGSKIAFVECQSPAAQDHPALGRDIKLFSDETDAEKWLLDVAAPPRSDPDQDAALPYRLVEDS